MKKSHVYPYEKNNPPPRSLFLHQFTLISPGEVIPSVAINEGCYSGKITP